MNKFDALTLFNEELKKYGIAPLTEKDAIDWVYDGMSESEVIMAANEFSSEEHSIKCENKFWVKNDWQN
jgi:hypothetical protein